MPFNTLLLTCCLLPNQTSFKQNQASISIEPEAGETVLFFSIDTEDNPNCKLRQLLKLDKTNQKICDLLVFYAKGEQRIICFVELKGKDLAGATDQVIQTYNGFKNFLSNDIKLFNYTPKAFIVSTGSTHKNYEQYKEKLEKIFGKNNYDHNGTSTDFGKFIRGIARQAKGKRKNMK